MKRKLKNKLEQLEKSFSELAKDVAELKQKENSLTITSEHTKNLEVDFENVETKNLSGWYKDDRYPKWLMYIDFENNKCFGFDSNRDWLDSSFSFEYKLNKAEYPATPSEVEQALIAEAKKRGFKVGFENTLNCVYTYAIKENDYYYDESINELYVRQKNNTFSKIFSKGKWAEIIEETPIKEEDVIDWNFPKLLEYIGDSGYFLVTSTGVNFNLEIFEGIVIYSENQIRPVGLNLKTFAKEYFKPFKGTLTINQE